MYLAKLTRENTPVPLYHQMKSRFIEALNSGQLKPSDRIPPEQKLCAEFGVSRGTVRSAIGELVKDGFLRREQGRGTFVQSPRLEKSLLTYFKFAEKDSSEALVPESRIIKTQKLTPSADVSKALGLSSGERVIKIKRLRMVKGNPFIYQVSFFPQKLFPGLERVDLDIPSLYQHIGDRYDIHVVQVEEYLTVGLPDGEARELLGLESDSPVIIIERKAFTFQEKAIEFRRSVGRADSYCYQIRL